MTEPDDDYENPIGEVLDAATVVALASAHLASSLFDLLKLKGGPKWPFI